MTIQEMKNLKLGDVVEDLELRNNINKKVLCVIIGVEDDMVYATALKKEDESRYPHIFRFNEKDCLKLSLPVNNINKKIYKTIFDNCRSIETFINRIKR